MAAVEYGWLECIERNVKIWKSWLKKNVKKLVEKNVKKLVEKNVKVG
jgi:hypothetical protein